jgi:hypothetical protein
MNYNNVSGTLRVLARKGVAKALRRMADGKSYKIRSLEYLFEDNILRTPKYYRTGNVLNILHQNGFIEKWRHFDESTASWINLYTITPEGERVINSLPEFEV